MVAVVASLYLVLPPPPAPPPPLVRLVENSADHSTTTATDYAELPRMSVGKTQVSEQSGRIGSLKTD